ncbi:hypothetical protein [Streptomyces sp. GC420]|uniref:hypothetical protein n=1 Tax=Streptomyces sp. GC420 TaxID=2697568 RepID=UPI0028BE4F8F|nr:hypothetical protein [Streptomyces sp. GC420]
MSEHLASCELCADVRDSLDEIRGLLGSLPGPTHMPADIADRIDAALAAEALLDAAAAAAANAPADVSRETDDDVAAVPASSGSVVSRETSLGGTSAHRAQRGQPAGRPQGATAPSGRSVTRRRRVRLLIGTVASAALLGLGALLAQSLGGAGDGTVEHSAASDTADQARTFDERNLESDVQALIDDRPPSAEPEAEPNGKSFGIESHGTLPKRAEETIPACVREGIGREDPPLAVERGLYEGTEAYLVVLPHGTQPSKVDAYVVDAACTGNTPPGKADVLLMRTYPRG